MQDVFTDRPLDTSVGPGGSVSGNPGFGTWTSTITMDESTRAAIALAEAMNRARQRQGNVSGETLDARAHAISRLETLRARLKPVYAAIPRDVESFDLGMIGHDLPRLFIDIIAYVEMGRNGTSFRLVQETRNGRLVLGKADDAETMVSLVTDYIALRLVERERALAVHATAAPAAPVQVSDDDEDASPARTNTSVAAETSFTRTSSEAAAHSAATQTTTSLATPVLAAQAVASTEAPVAPEAPAMPAAPAGPAIVKGAMENAGLAMGSIHRAANPVAAHVAAAESSLTRQKPARISSGASWFWPLFALLVGIGIGALLLYLYAEMLAKP